MEWKLASKNLLCCHDHRLVVFFFLRVNRIFLPDQTGRRPCHGGDTNYSADANWKDLVLFYEYFNGDSGLGCGAT